MLGEVAGVCVKLNGLAGCWGRDLGSSCFCSVITKKYCYKRGSSVKVVCKYIRSKRSY